MTLCRRFVLGGGALGGAALLAGVAGAAETVAPFMRYAEVRLGLGLRVAEGALRGLLPPGWRAAPTASGPSTGVTLRVDLVERHLVAGGDGKPLGPGRATDVVFVIPAREEAGPAAGAVTALVLTQAAYVPGPYRVEVAAEVVARQVDETGADGRSVLSVDWSATLSDGSRLVVGVTGVRGVPVRLVGSANVYSGKVPGFYRVYQTDQGADVMRGVGVVDRVSRLVLEGAGPRFAGLFEAAPVVVSVVATPWLLRTASAP